MPRDHFWELPLYLDSGMLPIVISVPPYHLWEPPPEEGHLPAHGSDFGIFQQADVLGMKSVIYVKDEDGLYDKDPKTHDDAVRYGEVELAELLARPPATSIIDREVFKAWRNSRNIRRVQIINGLVDGQLSAALAGENVGTVITKKENQ
jgi:molybdenum storage protein